jgi:hypothetical protein
MKVIMTNDHLKRFGGLYLLLVTYVSDYMFVPTLAIVGMQPQLNELQRAVQFLSGAIFNGSLSCAVGAVDTEILNVPKELSLPQLHAPSYSPARSPRRSTQHPNMTCFPRI